MVFQKMNSPKLKFQKMEEGDNFFHRARDAFGLKGNEELISIYEVCTEDNLVRAGIMRSKVIPQRSQKVVAPEGRTSGVPPEGTKHVLARLAI